MPPSRTPFQTIFLALETHHFKAFSSSTDPTSIFFFFNNIFKPNFWHRFWLNFRSWDTNFRENSFRRPEFQAEKSVTETLLLKTWAAHTYPNIFWVPTPSPRMIQSLDKWADFISVLEFITRVQCYMHSNRNKFRPFLSVIWLFDGCYFQHV